MCRHKENCLLIYKICAILSPKTYEQNNDLYSLCFRQKPLVTLPKRKIKLTHIYTYIEDNIKMDIQEVGWGHRLDRVGSG